MFLSMRFDFRNPAFAGTTMAERYAAAMDIAEWADGLGIPASISVSEHHGSEDGYIPSPQLIIAAMAARSKNVRFSTAATIAPFHDPLRLAEDFCVLDNITNGRVDLIVAGGYAPSEFAMFDVPIKERPKRVTEVVNTLKAAFAGEPFEYRGRTVHVTPAPVRPGGPKVIMGGASEPAARRAARIADGFVPSEAKFWEFYRDEMLKLGKTDPGPGMGGGSAQVTALAKDIDAGWAAMGESFLHETNAYAAWRVAAGEDTPYDPFPNVEELRGANFYHIVTPEEYVAQLKAAPMAVAQFHPLCGGMPIQAAWDSLKLFETEVLPAFR
ncbi:LLM class flavin-dependent oxidoreductase [Novosphingobium sp. JCM 18896]|uniref:LLM class flavin-dependent oxidoreductase n=1 Tax=Novosphingobium sp. JCM 18896 TaxID=2989731 RepID=UPI002223AC6D|nr:LLM class flavin-dependent oxidoreductase [Novosphingobium sp. JCM 18896]MCW1430081.1 LLM class flavin-dependent oxidoreductase [Novosphingobium sp. JCM 18896]